MTRGTSPQPSSVSSPHSAQFFPDCGNVLDLNPVQLDVLAVREVRGGASVVAGDFAHGAQLGRVHAATVETHAHHEVLVLQLCVAQLRSQLAAQVLVALGVEAEPLKAWGKILWRNRLKTLLGVDIDDALAGGQAAVFLLDLLVGVERVLAVNLPLPLGLARTSLALWFRCSSHGDEHLPFVVDDKNLPV